MPVVFPTPRAGSWTTGSGMGIPPDTPPRAGSWTTGDGNAPDIRAGSWTVGTFSHPGGLFFDEFHIGSGTLGT